MKDARRSTLSNAGKYKKDAEYLLELSRLNHDQFEGSLPKYRSIYIENLQLARLINEFCTVLYVYSRALKFRKGLSSREKLENWAQENNVNEEARMALFAMIEDYAAGTRPIPVVTTEEADDTSILRERGDCHSCRLSREGVEPRVELDHPTDPTSIAPPTGPQQDNPVADVTEPTTSSKKKRGGDNDLVGREDVKKMKTGTEKLNTIHSLASVVPDDLSELTEGAGSFYRKAIRPIVGFFNNHCPLEREEFLNKWGKGKYSNFPQSRFYKSCLGDASIGCNGFAEEEE